jgi:hypothetical protein
VAWFGLAAGKDKIMAHRHLILAYVLTIMGQLAYAGWVTLKYRAMRKLEREFPPYPVVTK